MLVEHECDDYGLGDTMNDCMVEVEVVDEIGWWFEVDLEEVVEEQEH